MARFWIKVTPGAKRNEIKDSFQRPDGKAAWRLSVTAPPEDGKANEAVIRLLAEMLDIRARDIEIIHGLASRDKLIEINHISEEARLKLGKL